MRLLRQDDAAALAAAYGKNRSFLKPWEPAWPASFYTETGQDAVIRRRLEQLESGQAIAWVLASGRSIVGRMTLSDISLWPVSRPNVGYWVDQDYTGRGLASAALGQLAQVARDVVGLHRLEAGTRLDNVASQRVLARAGFTKVGVARDFAHINGAWCDHLIFERLL